MKCFYATEWKGIIMEDLIFRSNKKVLFIGDSITDCGRRQDEEKLGHGYVRKITELITAKYQSSY